jgi:group I intron endonuclease
MRNGIYSIKCLENGKSYVGSTHNLEKRWDQHKYKLKKNAHFNSYLQNSWNKYGEGRFAYSIVEETDDLLGREEYWIGELKSHILENGFNICKIPRASRLGCRASRETLTKMKNSLSGDKHPNWKRKFSEQHIMNMSLSQKGLSKENSGKKKKFKVIDPNGKLVELFGLRKFCRNENLDFQSMWNVCIGKRLEYNGWKSVYEVKKMILDKMVIARCGTNEYLFNSASEASRSQIFDKKLNQQNISCCCNGKSKYCGKINGIKVRWEFK